MQNDTFTFCLDEFNGIKSFLKQNPWLDTFYKMPNETFYDGMKIELKHNYREIVSEEIIFALESIREYFYSVIFEIS